MAGVWAKAPSSLLHFTWLVSQNRGRGQGCIGRVGGYPSPPWRRAQKILLQRTTSKSHIGELAPLALCDIHVADCGEHLLAWGLRDERIPGTDQAVRGGCHGQRLHSGFPPRRVDARSSADACLSWQKVQGREASRRRHRLTEPTTKALCQTPPPHTPSELVTNTVYTQWNCRTLLHLHTRTCICGVLC